MKKSTALAGGAALGLWITGVSIVAPGGMTSDDQSAGVVRTTPSVSPFPSAGTVPVETPSAAPGAHLAERRVISPSKSPAARPKEKTPASVSQRPSASPSAVRKPQKTTAPNTSKSKSPAKPPEKVTTIAGYSACFGFAQRCIDQGKLTLYNPGQLTLAGHNYMGYQWMSRLPVGRVVKVTSGQVAGTYKVYGHAWSKRAKAGGKFPAAGYSADLVLQTCEPNGTGFSLLRRV